MIATGLFSAVRSDVLKREVVPEETGDLAWRTTISRSKIEASNDRKLNEVTKALRPMGWLGPDTHVAFYPLRGGEVYNLVIAFVRHFPRVGAVLIDGGQAAR